MIAFYAPLKSPDFPTASGDRRMAQLLLAALTRAGLAPRLESSLRAYEPTGAQEAQAVVQECAATEVKRLLELYQAQPELRPRLWFTYHCYYKAVDYIGPVIARALNIPYCVAEASRAPQRATGMFAQAHAMNEAALDFASMIFVMTAKDRPALEQARTAGQQLIDLPPFIDQCAATYRPRASRDVVELLSVAMMRWGVKRESYGQLAQALALVDGPWHLTIVGEGEAQAEVEALFAPFAERVTFTGLVSDADALAALYEKADLLVWPAVNEAYGMVFLEAAAYGCPALAGDHGGVASVVCDGQTGILVPPGDIAAFAQALSGLIEAPARRQALGAQAYAFVRESRTLDSAATILHEALVPLIGRVRV
ncbi:glycosyltransferase family 4 protein [Pseudochelatococcus sp. G4_1912]|uniref:glycosyltransferase family 4 protein n=1 Tax=Pseudochelatococcus sp. G4_1912 TaxID=3114288 RepID=UPI0039C70DAB